MRMYCRCTVHVNQISEVIESREFEEFKMALQHKFKLWVYKESKKEVEFEE